MKKIINISLVLFALLTGSSCNEFLEENPPSAYTPDNFYASYVQAQNSVNGIYAFTISLHGSVLGAAFDDLNMVMLECATGQANTDVHISIGKDEVLTLSPSSANVYVRSWWRTSYFGINAANLAIANISNMSPTIITDVQRKNLLGEAQFLRAWFYFNLVRIFGDVPILTAPTTSAAGLEVQRNAVKDVYEQVILPDLLAAEKSGLPAADKTGRVSTGAVKALLAKVYQTMAGYPLKQADKMALAKQKALEVINSGNYTLYNNYDEFRDAANDNMKENIFMIQYKAGIIANPMFGYTQPLYGGVTNGSGGTGGLTPDITFYNSFKDTDKRKQKNQYFYSNYKSNTTGADIKFATGQHIFKYFDNESYTSNGPSSKCFSVIRLTDIMLLYAEAQNEVDGAPDENSYNYINKVRARAELPLLSGLNQKQFREAVWRERNHELCFENITWFDMVRTRIAYDTKNDSFAPLIGYTFPYGANIVFKEKNLLFPVPDYEMQTNSKLSQNPGY